MDTTIESMLDYQNNSPTPNQTPITMPILKWIQRIALVSGLASLAVSFLVLPENSWLLTAAFALLSISAFLEFGFRWRALKRAAARQDWRRYGHLQEIIERLGEGFDVVSPVIPTIELDGQTVVVLRAWSAQTGKAILLLNQDGRAIQDQDVWRKSILLIEFANACLPGVTRNRRAIINTNLYARHPASSAWKRALKNNKDSFHHLGQSTEIQLLLEHWEALESFLDLRIALFQSEDRVVDQVTVPSASQEEIKAWISTQEQIHKTMETLIPKAEKISRAAAHLLTAWLDNRSKLEWDRPDELEAGLKFAYLFQSLLKRSLNRWHKLMQPDLRTFHRGLELARETGLMVKTSD
jgi:hypothetical protein